MLFAEHFYLERVLNFANVFSTLRCACGFFPLHFVDVVYYIDHFLCVEPFLQSRNKSHWVMVSHGASF